MKTKLADEKVVNDLERLIKKSKGKISPADASATTGYPLEQVKDALSRLIELYEARVTMDNETGQIQFIFKYPFFRRGKKTIKEILQNVLEILWKGFQIVYKASIGIILIFYTVIFILILIAIIFAGRSSDRDSKIDIGSILGGLFRGILDAYTFSLITRDISYRYDDYGYRYKSYQPEKNRGKGFVKSVFSFVFGPERPKYDPLEDAKEAIAFIRQNNGRITAGHIVALTGLSFEEAEARLAEYAVKFNGELEITEEGYVVAEFTDLMNKASDEFKGGKIVFYEDEVEPPYELTGNSSGRNFAIAGMNLFNLFMSFILINSFNETIYAHENMSTSELIMYNLQEFGWIVIVLGYFPFISYKENMLILAEAQARTGQTADATTALNTIRKEAGLKDYSGNDLIGEILHQKFLQLFLEGQVYTDMRRTKTKPSPNMPMRFIYPITEYNANPNVPKDSETLVMWEK